MISGIGVDIEEIKQFENKSENFLNLIFTDKEIKYCKRKKEPYVSFAGKFCAKEAVIKALDKKISIKDIEVLNLKSGFPVIYVKGKKNNKIHCSISHSEKQAIAFVIIIS